MKNIVLSLLLMLACAPRAAADDRTIRLTTGTTDWVMHIGDEGRLYQSYLGPRLGASVELDGEGWTLQTRRSQGRGWEVCPGQGGATYFEPALGIVHADGNRSTVLAWHSTTQRDVPGGTETTVCLRDDAYPVEVKLHFVAYAEENVFKAWAEVRHSEDAPVHLTRYASSMLYFTAPAYYLTEPSGDWAREAQLSTQPLLPGKKLLDTHLGSRAAMHMSPFFMLGLGAPAAERSGSVLLGTIAWTGNFRFTFEVDNVGDLRVVSGINPYASDYELQPGATFITPEFIFTLSQEGTGCASRDLHRWARRYQLKDGQGPRRTLLNNWENTGFDFDEARLAALMQEAKDLGVDLFLLDDGWFGNRYPRSNDRAGLGDWEPTREKLPGGIEALVDHAERAGVDFGIWIEPEMVNPKSALFEEHPDWAIRLPNRATYYFRNQLVLDLANPAVQDHVYGVVAGIVRSNPGVKYLKWDCNSPITNIYSPHLGERQGQLYVDYVRGLYAVLDRVKRDFPLVQMMLCSGGGGRCDYGALRYFSEFWCSDNTDPVERLYIQWGFSQVFPAKAMCAHVTNWNRATSMKFRTDVAAMCKLGFDISLDGMSERDRAFCRQAVAGWKRLAPVVMDGDLYRLVSPYEGEHMAVSYVDSTRQHAVLFAYDIHPRYGEPLRPVRLEGLDPDRLYRVEETNLVPGTTSHLAAHGLTLSGDYLMKVGLDVFTTGATRSRVVELTAL